MTVNKQRLDIRMVETGLVQSRQRAQALIMSGRVLVNQVLADKAGMNVSELDEITLTGEDIPYVSRGGLKLEAALNAFNIDVKNKICLDVGASTGGFTDCLLQNGAAKVFSVDVGYGQLAWKLRQDSRVVVIERTNIRYMPFEKISELVDIVTIDTSFISLKIVVPAVFKFMKEQAIILALIKPQFEVGKGKVGKGGVVRDSNQHQEVIASLSVFFQSIGLIPKGTIESPVLGPKGNKEFILMLNKK